MSIFGTLTKWVGKNLLKEDTPQAPAPTPRLTTPTAPTIAGTYSSPGTSGGGDLGKPMDLMQAVPNPKTAQYETFKSIGQGISNLLPKNTTPLEYKDTVPESAKAPKEMPGPISVLDKLTNFATEFINPASATNAETVASIERGRQPGASEEDRSALTRSFSEPILGLSGGLESKGATALKGATQSKKILAELDEIFKPEKVARPGFFDTVKSATNKTQTALTSRFTPLRIAEENIYKTLEGKAPKLDMARRFELVAGAQGKAQADVRKFANEVIGNLPKGSEESFNKVLFLERTKQRLLENPALKKVGDWTIEKVNTGINALKSNIGDDIYNSVSEVANGVYQKNMDDALRLQVTSGRMSEEVYNAIKASNDFYAPFKVLKYIDEAASTPGMGASIQSKADLTKAISGISSEDFKLQNILQSSAEQISRSRILAEKNMAIQDFAKLAPLDKTGNVVREVPAGTKVRKGYEIVSYLENGKSKYLEVNKDVAKAITGLDRQQADIVAKTALGYAAIPFRAGATSMNAGFQTANLLAADLPRAAIISKYGIQNPFDAIRFGGDFIHALYSSFRGNLARSTAKMDPLYKQFLDSGAANSSFSRELRPQAFKKTLNISEPITAKNAIPRFAGTVLDSLSKFSNAIEETNKILGIKRGVRIEKIADLPPEQAQQKLMEVASEVRNFSGSPDFARSGDYTKPMNLLYMFLNARIQGVSADLSRLGLQSGVKEGAASWARMATGVGVPTVSLYAYNHSTDELRKEYEKLTQRDKDNYFHIPKGKYIKDYNGNDVMDYWRIPKREAVQMVANGIEGSMAFAQERDPAAFLTMVGGLLESLSPINIQGDSVTERMQSVASGLNPVAKVPLEFATGKNLYFHSDTIPLSMQGAKETEQYRASTPEMYVKAGQLTGQSPLKLEQAAKSFTGGAVTQFQDPNVEGRNAVENSTFLSPILRRFQRSLSSNTQQFNDAIGEAQAEQKGASVDLRRKAETLFTKMKEMPPAEANQLLQETAKEDKALANKVVTIKKEDDLGITYEDRAIKSLYVQNGDRAKFIYNWVTNNLETNEERNAYLNDLRRKKVLTEEVDKQLAALIAKNK